MESTTASARPTAPVLPFQSFRQSRPCAFLLAEADNSIEIARTVIGKLIDRHHRLDAEEPDIFDVLGEVSEAAVFGVAAMIRHGLAGGDDDRCGGEGRRSRHLMWKNFSAPRSVPNRPRSPRNRSAKARSGRDGGVGALRNVGEGAAMDEGRGAFERLHDIRVDRVAAAAPAWRRPPRSRGAYRLALVV